MDGRLTLTVVTPERAVVAGVACDEVTLPGLDGELGILPAHTPLIALLGIGARDVPRRVEEDVRRRARRLRRDRERRRARPRGRGGRQGRDRRGEGRDQEKAAAEARRADVVGDEQLDAANADAKFAEARISVAAS